MHKEILIAVAIMVVSIVLFALLPMTMKHYEITGITTSDACGKFGTGTACGIWDEKSKVCFKATKSSDGTICEKKPNYMPFVQLVAAIVLFILSLVLLYQGTSHMKMPQTPPY